MIDIIHIEGGLPISIIIPLQEKRKKFFYDIVLPLIKANNPSEIIINSNDGSASKKRNEGFDKSKNPYILFSDDDIIYPITYFEILLDQLKNDSCGYVYTGCIGIVLDVENNSMKTNFEIPTIDFDENILKRENYISNMTLIKREAFVYFDETLPRYQDYDLYLHMLSKGIKGKAVYGTKFYAFYMDEGISSMNNNTITYSDIQKKYNFDSAKE